jgi:LPS sulfotransferase NodH
VYLVAGTPRTGTNMLCEALTAAGAGHPEEWFSRRRLAKTELVRRWPSEAAGTERAAACRAYLLDLLRRTCRNGISGFKLHWHQLQRLTDLGCHSAIDELLSGELLSARVRAVLITRSPVDVQAVSVLKAYASGVFAVDHAGREVTYRHDDAFWGPPGVAAAARARLAAGDLYNFADMQRICHAIERANEDWRRYLRRLHVPIPELSYDELAGDVVARTNETVAHLGVPVRLPPGYQPGLLIQRDATSAGIVARFRREGQLAKPRIGQRRTT